MPNTSISQDFCKKILCKELGLYVYLRPGPYITNEMDGAKSLNAYFDKAVKNSMSRLFIIAPQIKLIEQTSNAPLLWHGL